jgi:hypothetical protein
LTGAVAAIFSVATIAAFILTGFGVRFTMGKEHRKNGLLMIVAGLVLWGNVAIITI